MLHQLTDGWHKLNSIYEHVTHISEFLLGFSNIPHIRYFYVFLCFVYIMTVLGNGFLLLVIWLVKTLHTPKYMIVFNMALTDLFGITNIAAWASYIDPNARMINYTLTHTIPPLLNPIVYALKTEEVKNAIKKLCKRNNVSNTVTKW
ncbi:olfactory receptor 7A42-like [Pelmatolapia mariae]|uniref:olfactory receptor 7A42-like n=1 Tax=Pelmatolapia mariae TaxID=158779 RepID=UPI002FE61BB3